MRWFAIAIFFSSVIPVRSDYKCVCSYTVETNVYSKPTVVGDILGYMYEFDCKPDAGQSGDKWLSVAFEHQLGYLENNGHLQIQTCQGNVPDEDRLASVTNMSVVTPTPTTAELTTTETSITTSEKIASTATPVSTTTTESPTSTAKPTQTTTLERISSRTAQMTTTTKEPFTTEMIKATTTMQPNTASFATSSTQNPETLKPVRSTTQSTTTETSTQNPETLKPVRSTTQSTTTQTSTQNPETLKPVRSTTQSTATQTSTQNPTTSKPFMTTQYEKTSQTQTQTRQIVTTSIPLPNANTIQGHLELCSSRIKQAAMKDHAIIAQFGDNCYEVDRSAVSWSHAESVCQQNGGHLAHIANHKEQAFIYNFLVKHHSHSVWIGLHDRNYEENFEWTSGDAVAYTNWTPGRKNHNHDSQDCVFMSSSNGQWNDRNCGGDNPKLEDEGNRHAYICQFATVTAATVSPLNPAHDGNINMCSLHLRQQASKDAGTLAQYGQSCYEVVPSTNLTWTQAESFCHKRGGHLAHISNAQEQLFILGFMQRYSPQHAVWIGLTDRQHEGHFHWTSGNAVHYTNWVPGHISNFVHHSQEDCVAFIPYKNGQWDDIPCGKTVSQHHHTHTVGEVHPVLCQYGTAAGPQFIG